jgi:transglutaminase-like putative cysteine protease
MPWVNNTGIGAGPVGVTRVHKRTLPRNAEAASMQTLEVIHELAREGREDPYVRDVTIRILRDAHVPEKNKTAIIRTIHSWIQKHLYYINDPVDVETIATARVILQQALGGNSSWDCDDFVVLGHAMLNAVGIPTRSVIIKGEAIAPTQWSHIYLEAHDGRRWVPMDLIMKDKPLGWEPPIHYGKKVIPLRPGKVFPTERLGQVPSNMTTEYV